MAHAKPATKEALVAAFFALYWCLWRGGLATLVNVIVAVAIGPFSVLAMHVLVFSALHHCFVGLVRALTNWLRNTQRSQMCPTMSLLFNIFSVSNDSASSESNEERQDNEPRHLLCKVVRIVENS